MNLWAIVCFGVIFLLTPIAIGLKHDWNDNDLISHIIAITLILFFVGIYLLVIRWCKDD